MRMFAVRLLERRECGRGIVVVRWSRPAGYEFLPGQYFMLRLQTAEGLLAKPFSFASAPGDPYVEMATRVSSSAFKQALIALPVAGDAEISAAAGGLVLPEGTLNVGVLVGGVGITPVRSILRDAMQRGTGLDVVLVYGNRDESCMPFAAELDAMAPHGVRVEHVLERASTSWAGHTGLISADLAHRLIPDAGQRLFVVAGPPAMVAAMEAVLDALGVEPQRRLIERFGGYA